MSQTMRAVGVFQGRKEVRLVEHVAPQISHKDEVKVRSLEVGICGTDKEICHFVYGQPPSGFEYLVIGHESLGVVEDVGSSVRGLKPGDLVVPSVRRPCNGPQYQPCRAELQDYCATGQFTESGIKKRHGLMTKKYVEREQLINIISGNISKIAVVEEDQ